MNILITYDISQRWTEVKRALLDEGFKDSWVDNQTRFNLPDTTLWHNKLNNANQAKAMFHEVIEQLNAGQPEDKKIEIERFMAVVFTKWSGIPGKPHS